MWSDLGIFSDHFTANLLRSMPMKESSINICQKVGG